MQVPNKFKFVFWNFLEFFSTIFYTLLIKSEDIETTYRESWFDMFELPGKLHRLLIILLYILDMKEYASNFQILMCTWFKMI